MAVRLSVTFVRSVATALSVSVRLTGPSSVSGTSEKHGERVSVTRTPFNPLEITSDTGEYNKKYQDAGTAKFVQPQV